MRQLIVAGTISRGRRLRESEWAERLQTNRGALREAFGRLCGEGLLQEGPVTGYYVPDRNPNETGDLLEVCKALELAAIERICQLCLNTAAHLAPARKACDELGWLLGQGYSVELGESDRRFHHALVALAGNGRSSSVHYQASVAASMGDDWNVEDWLRSGQTALEEHRAIVDLLQERELLKAQRLLRDHWAGRMRTHCSSGEVARPVPVMPVVTPLL